MVAPKVWVYFKYRAKSVAKTFDKLFCILPFEPQYFEKYGMNVKFVGMPTVSSGNAWFEPYREKTEKKIAITIGSRISEINKHILIIRDFVEKMITERKDLRFIILTTESTNGFIISEFANFVNKIDFVYNDKEKYEAMKGCTFGVAKSGTNNLEFTMAGVPIVSYYRVSPFTALLARLMFKIKYMNLINIIAEREIIPELKQGEVNVKRLIKVTSEYLDDTELQKTQVKDAQEVLETMKNPNGISFQKDIVSSLI